MKWEPEQSPGYLIIRAARLGVRAADRLLKPLGVAGGQVPILGALRDGASLSQSALARVVGIEQPTMAATLTRMERDGLIVRRPDPADGRSSLISPTPAALAKLPEIVAALGRGREDLLAGFTAAERATLVGLLTRVVANLEAAAGRDDGPKPPPTAAP